MFQHWNGTGNWKPSPWEAIAVHAIFLHDDVLNWKHFSRFWPFARGIHRSPVDSPHKEQWHRVLMFSLICAWTNDWANNRDAGDLRRHCVHYDVTVMEYVPWLLPRNELRHHYCEVIVSAMAFQITCITIVYSNVYLGGNSPITGEFPSQRPVTWIFDVFSDRRMSKRLSKKKTWGWWFETPSRSLFTVCHCI